MLQYTVELAIKQFSLLTLSYQPYFNPRSKSYVIYGLIIYHNQSYFNNHRLYWIIPTKPKKTIDPDFYWDHIVRLSYLIRLFLLTYVQTLHNIFLRSYFLFSLHLSALSNTLLSLIIFLDIKQQKILSSLYIYIYLTCPSYTN